MDEARVYMRIPVLRRFGDSCLVFQYLQHRPTEQTGLEWVLLEWILLEWILLEWILDTVRMDTVRMDTGYC
jgi:hypothetical protein